METGIPASSKRDFKARKTNAETIKETAVTGLARSVKSEIDISWDALKVAAEPCLHLVLATSPIHMTYKLKKSPEQVIEMEVDSVAFALQKFHKVQLSEEDASETDWNFVVQ